jgi:hypothetical protein
MIEVTKGFRTAILCVTVMIPFITTELMAAGGTTYYVDYQKGSNSNAGISTAAPFRHCPGDPSATGVPASTTLYPGDTVIFKGGVKYRGRIEMKWAGNSSDPITYTSDPNWGSGKPILTGADSFSQSWTQCASASTCWDNPNYANIWYTTIPSGTTFENRLLQDGEFLWFAMEPDMTDPIHWDSPKADWYAIPYNYMTKTSIKNTSVFTQASSSYWDGAYVGAYCSGNTTEMSAITGFNPSTNTVTMESLYGTPISSGTTYHSVLNHPALIDTEGEYAFRPSENRVYLWAAGGGDPGLQTLEISKRKEVFYGVASDIVIDGLYLTGTYGRTKETTSGGAINPTSGGSGNFTVRNCEVEWLSSIRFMGAIRLLSNGVNRAENNEIKNCFQNRAIHMWKGSSCYVVDNVIDRVGYTGIRFTGGKNVTISANAIRNIHSVHANGITVEGTSTAPMTNITIERNYLEDLSRGLTLKYVKDVNIKNNIVDNGGKSQYSAFWERPENIKILNNLFVNSTYKNGALYFPFATNGQVQLYNNVIDGMSGTGMPTASNRSHNVYTRLIPDSLGSSELYITDMSMLFVNYDNTDYRPTDNGYLIDAGKDVAWYGVSEDILGVPRPQKRRYDIGAFEGCQTESEIGQVASPEGLRVFSKK